MSDKKWTEAQTSAIEDEGGTLLVSAAAGSGKTAVLVERAVRLITREENPIPADRLLIATFTNAAAEELRSRIGSRLEEEVRAHPLNTALRRQRLLLRRAFIGTIDAFCIQLVREHFGVLDIPPDVGIADAPLLEQLSQEAIEQTMESLYQNKNFVRFASLYGRARSDNHAAEAVLALFDFTRTLPHPEKQLASFAAMYTKDVTLPQTSWGKELFSYAKGALESACRLCKTALSAVQFDETLNAYVPVLQEDHSAATELLRLVSLFKWDDALVFLHGHSFGRSPNMRGSDGPDKERVKLLRSMVKAIFTDLKKYCFVCSAQEYDADIAELAPLVASLCQGASEYGKLFSELKLAEKVLDFSDFEHLALQLLQDKNGAPTKTAEHISRRYYSVMVDEYQDTNELQDALYTCLANPQASNLFYVGDAKQSIYRFRKANPGIFLAKKDNWEKFSSKEHPAVITLGHNFRSASGVINGINFLFDTLMSRELGDITYNEHERLIPGKQAEEKSNCGLELHIVQDADGQNDAAFVASHIARMLHEKQPIQIGDETRPCRPDDFCILLRARGNMRSYIAALENAGLVASADLAGELLYTPEVLPLTAMLCAIDNPGDDVNLAAALLGPLLNFTADDLVQLRANAPHSNLWGALSQSEEDQIHKCVLQFNFYRTLAAEVPAGRLCEEIVNRTNYLSAVAAMEGGPARQENLLRFISWANEVSSAGRGGLASFVRILQNGKGPAETSARSLPGHVSILTIHKSKGLEFPICILADAAHGFNKMDLRVRVQMHSDLGIGMALREGGLLYPTLPALAIRHRALQEMLSEEMRILYVALTRAKNLAIVTFAVKDATKYLSGLAAELSDEAPEPFLLARASSMASWVTTAALCHPNADTLLQFTGGLIPPKRQGNGHFEMQVHPQLTAEDHQTEAYQLSALPNASLVNALASSFEQKPPRISMVGLPIKISVSSIAKEEGPHLLKRPSFMYKSGLTAAEKGTAQHAFMQFANFASASANLQAEVERLTSEGFLNADLADKLDVEGIELFLSSPLALRMQKAKKLLREYDFITSIPAGVISPELLEPFSNEPVLVQGIADAVIVSDDSIEIADYKTDRNTSPEKLVQRYQTQLLLYGQAISKRLGLPLKQLTIWAFSLNREVSVPFLPPK